MKSAVGMENPGCYAEGVAMERDCWWRSDWMMVH